MEYQPFSEQWENHLMRISKTDLERIFNVSGSGITKKEQIQKIKARQIQKLKEEYINTPPKQA